MSSFTQDSDALDTHVLSIALIGPEEQRRRAVARALADSQSNVTREFASYPDLDDMPRLLEADYDVIIVELDSNPEQALDLVEYICGNSSVTVMVYSSRSDSETLVRCMRAGAREFLTHPIAPNTIAEALIRASVRHPVSRQAKKTLGKLLVFAGAKGGAGVTTIASNFAIALAQESGKSTALLDLNLPLGNAALDLGITAPFSTANALQNSSRLDSNFLSTLLTKHSSGLSVLAAPDRYTGTNISGQSLEKLIAITRQDFEYVVADAGSSMGPACRPLFDLATSVYLVTQVGISELRNANRLVTEFFAPGGKLQIVLNRFVPRSLEIDEENITKALTTGAKWKIPSDYPAVRKAQNTVVPLVEENSPISRVIRQMARVACGLPANPEKKKGFSLFG